MPKAVQQVTRVIADNTDGTRSELSLDSNNTQPGDTRTTTTDLSGRVTSDVFDYGNAVDDYVRTHALMGGVATGLSEAAAEQFVAAVEREIYSGDTTNPSSVSSVFGSDNAFARLTTGLALTNADLLVL